MMLTLFNKTVLCGVAALTAIGGAYMKGRMDCDKRRVLQEAAIATEAVKLYVSSQAQQNTANELDREAIQVERDRLRDLLNDRSVDHVSSGNASIDNCIGPHDVFRLRENYRAVFEK